MIYNYIILYNNREHTWIIAKTMELLSPEESVTRFEREGRAFFSLENCFFVALFVENLNRLAIAIQPHPAQLKMGWCKADNE